MATFGLRAARLDQPIVENYVGRQVPTAMVARNLDRGSGFLWPQLETGPFPNLFLVEPPIYATAAVGLKRLTGLHLEECGRLVSALATALGTWGLFGLARRREGAGVALLAVAAFALFPVMIRYGRAFQPDALMLGLTSAGLRCWDQSESGERERPLSLAAGWVLLTLGIAVKVTSAFLLIPLLVVIVRRRRGFPIALALAALTLVPAVDWYVRAFRLLNTTAGSLASRENAAIWLDTLRLSALTKSTTYVHLARFLLWRAFTPAGLLLAAWGLTRDVDRLWRVWALAAGATLVVLAGKLHHEYYWMVLAPPLAVGVARALVTLATRGPRGRTLATATGAGFAALCVALSWSTWRTPAEWSGLAQAAEEARGCVQSWGWLVAPEALIYAAERPGCRLETEPAAVARAASEWGGTPVGDGPLALVEFYRWRGARYFGDVFDPAADPRPELHEEVRLRYEVLIDRPGFLFARLARKGTQKALPPPPPLARLP